MPYEEFEDFSLQDANLECRNESEENSALQMLLDIAKKEVENDNNDVSSVDVQAHTICETSIDQEPAAKKQKTVSYSDTQCAILRSPSPGGSSDSDATVDLDFVPTDFETFKSTS